MMISNFSRGRCNSIYFSGKSYRGFFYIRNRLVKSRYFSDINRSQPFFDDEIQKYAVMPVTKMSLRELLKWAEKPVTQEKVLKSAQYVRRELPIRLARRAVDMQQLPFIVGSNPHVKFVYTLYVESFEKLKNFPKIQSESDENEFTLLLSELVQSHSEVIQSISKGMIECSKYMKADDINGFLDRMIRARIGIRVIAEHHLAIHHDKKDYSGIVNHKLSPLKLLKRIVPHIQEICDMNYAGYPEVRINGLTDTTFPYIDVHLEYILFEILKNSFRATVERCSRLQILDIPPVEVTIARDDDAVSIRVRDQGGGIPESKLHEIWRYSYTTVDSNGPDTSNAGVLSRASEMGAITGSGGAIAGFGYGLPMSRIYAKWAGGSLELISLPDYGCDVFLRLPHIGSVSALQI